MAKILMKGNEALAEAAIRAGVDGFFAYPITPQNEVGEYISAHLPKAGGVFIQAESEISAVNMVFGAAATGKRAMTSSSGPGLSLKQETLSSLAAAELPCVIANMSRGGPGLGNIAPAQGDYFQAVKGGGHGDYHLIVLSPSTVQEMVDLTLGSFDLAEKWRLPVMILGDGILGQMMEPVDFHDTKRPDPPKQPPAWAVGNYALDNQPRLVQSLHLQGDKLYQFSIQQKEKWDAIAREETRVEFIGFDQPDGVDYAFSSFGSSARIAKTALKLAQKKGLKIGLIRPISLWPFPYAQIREKVSGLKGILNIEMNLGQMVEDIRLAVDGGVPVRHFPCPGGKVPTPEEILAEFESLFLN